GDTWIHGVGSDPTKVSQFRELSRLRREWLEDMKPVTSEPRFGAFSRALIMVPEHTWGMDIKLHLNDFEHYAREPFNVARNRPNFQKFESSWQEQRDYLEMAVNALGDSHEGEEARQRLAKIVPINRISRTFKKSPIPRRYLRRPISSWALTRPAVRSIG